MKIDQQWIFAREHTPRTIVCSERDHLVARLSVPVVIFYRRPIPVEVLTDSLRRALSLFPIFAGRLELTSGRLSINCNNAGVSLSVARQEQGWEQCVDDLVARRGRMLMEGIPPKRAQSGQAPLFTVRVNHLADGSMVLGCCWHHAVGDMNTFMCFMKAWSEITQGYDPVEPLIVEDRQGYLQQNMEDNGNQTPGVRYLGLTDMASYAWYSLTRARKYTALRFYFTEPEIAGLKKDLSARCDCTLSANDALCAHMMGFISQADEEVEKRYLSVSVNYRSRVGLSGNLLGNMVASINVPHRRGDDPAETAGTIRRMIDNYRQETMDCHATWRAIRGKNGGRSWRRFISRSLDPINHNLLITNWSKFGVYGLTFGGDAPFYFSPAAEMPFPWVSGITEGFNNTGLIYSVVLPHEVAAKVASDQVRAQIHYCRPPEDTIPEIAQRLF